MKKKNQLNIGKKINKGLAVGVTATMLAAGTLSGCGDIMTEPEEETEETVTTNYPDKNNPVFSITNYPNGDCETFYKNGDYKYEYAETGEIYYTYAQGSIAERREYHYGDIMERIKYVTSFQPGRDANSYRKDFQFRDLYRAGGYKLYDGGHLIVRNGIQIENTSRYPGALLEDTTQQYQRPFDEIENGKYPQQSRTTQTETQTLNGIDYTYEK